MNTQITVVDQALVSVPYIHPRLAAPSDNTPGESGADGTNCGKRWQENLTWCNNGNEGLKTGLIFCVLECI